MLDMVEREDSLEKGLSLTWAESEVKKSKGPTHAVLLVKTSGCI